MKNVLVLILFVYGLVLTGCTVEQKKPMGANPNLDEGFAGFGTMRAKELEGPLSDMMVPDEIVKGRSQIADDIADGNPYLIREPNLGFNGKKDGVNIYSGRAALINDKHMTSDRPNLGKKQNIVERKDGKIEEKIAQRLKNMQTISHVYVASADGYLLVGVESNEQDRTKLLREINKEISEVTTLDNVRVALDRPNISRIKKLQSKLQQAK